MMVECLSCGVIMNLRDIGKHDCPKDAVQKALEDYREEDQEDYRKEYQEDYHP